MRILDSFRNLIKRSLDIPSTPISATNLDGSGTNILYSTASDAGVQVNEWNALSITPVYASISLIADTIGYLDLPVYQTTSINGKRSKRRDDEHIVYQLLQSPNDSMNGETLRSLLMSHALGWGNGYAYIEYGNNFQPSSIKPLLPDRTYPFRLNTGELVYVTRVNGTNVSLRPDEVLHIRGFTFNGLNGLSPIGLFRQVIGKQMAYDKFGAKFFANGANASGILTHPGNLSKDAQERLREQITNKISGIDNAHKVMILEEAMKFEKITINPNDAQWLDAMKYGVADIARIFRVPPHLIGDLERSTNNNIEQQTLDFKTHCLNPWLVRWEQEVNRKLFPIQERGTFGVRFDLTNLLRGDMAATSTYYKEMSTVLEVNEIREALDKNPVDYGDVIMVQTQYAPLDTVIKNAANPPAPGKTDAPKVDEEPTDAPESTPDPSSTEETDQNSVERTQRTLEARTKLDAQYRSLFRYAIGNSLNTDQLRQVLLPYASAVRSVAIEEAGKPLPNGSSLDSWTTQYCSSMAKRLHQTSEDSADERCDYEQRRFRSAVTRETYSQCGISSVRWIGEGVLEGKCVNINEPFMTDGERKIYHPPLNTKCRGEILPEKTK